MPAHEVEQRRLGVLLVLGATIAWSTAGFFTRLIQLDPWTILVWRGLFGGAFVGAFLISRHGREAWRMTRGMGWPGWIVTACSTAAMSAFIPALKLTSVANVAIIYATVPFFAAFLAWAWHGERASRPVLVASAIALLGIGITVTGSGAGGTALGDLVALFTTAASAAMIVALRHYRAIPLLPTACLANLLGALLALPFAAPLDLASGDLVNLALFGFFQITLGLTLFTIGSRLIPASNAALINVLESPLAPFWVWLAFGDVPSAATLVGGAVVLAAVVGQLWWDNRKKSSTIDN